MKLFEIPKPNFNKVKSDYKDLITCEPNFISQWTFWHCPLFLKYLHLKKGESILIINKYKFVYITTKIMSYAQAMLIWYNRKIYFTHQWTNIPFCAFI